MLADTSVERCAIQEVEVGGCFSLRYLACSDKVLVLSKGLTTNLYFRTKFEDQTRHFELCAQQHLLNPFSCHQGGDDGVRLYNLPKQRHRLPFTC